MSSIFDNPQKVVFHCLGEHDEVFNNKDSNRTSITNDKKPRKTAKNAKTSYEYKAKQTKLLFKTIAGNDKITFLRDSSDIILSHKKEKEVGSMSFISISLDANESFTLQVKYADTNIVNLVRIDKLNNNNSKVLFFL